MKVAIPVKDSGLEIIARTGRAPFYAIFEVTDSNFTLLELRENLHAQEHEHEHGEHEEEFSEEEVRHHRNQLKNIGDVDAVVVWGLGPNMKGAMEAENIKVIRASRKDGITADETIKKLFLSQK